MNCPHCHGRGRTVGKVTFHNGTDARPTELAEIGICPSCFGVGTVHCCDGDREQAMLAATNPNEAG